MEVKCSWCIKKFDGTAEFLNHFFARHRCPKPTKNTLNLKSAVQYSCEICGKQIITTSNENMRKHIERHFGIMPFYCELCYFPTVSENSLWLHQLRCHQQSPRLINLGYHHCDICNSHFKTLNELMRHYVKHLKKMPFSCGICKTMFQEEIDLVVHSHLHAETNHCFICAETYSTRPELLAHVLTHRKSRFFRNFTTRLQNGMLLYIFPQKNSSFPKIETLQCGESLRDFELETTVVPEIIKLRTSDPIGSHGAPKSTTSGAIESQGASELITLNAIGSQGRTKSRTSGAIESQGASESRTSGAIESQGASESTTSGAIESQCASELITLNAIGSQGRTKSRTSGAIESQGASESRTSGAIESQGASESITSCAIKSQYAPELITLNAIGSQGGPESRTLNAIESCSINEPRTSDAIGTLRNPDAIESCSINESRTLFMRHHAAIGSLRNSDCFESLSLEATGVHGNNNNSILIENNFNPKNSDLVKKEKDQPRMLYSNVMDSSKLKTCIGSLDDPNLRTSDIIESRRTADVVESRDNSNLKLGTLDDVKNGNDSIINYNYALAECSRDIGEEPEFDVWSKTIKKEPDIEYQEDIDYLCDVVMEEKQFDLKHFISNFSKDTRSNDQISERSMQPNGLASNAYFCSLVKIENDSETTSIKDCNTYAKGIQGTNFQSISLQENSNLVSLLPLTASMPDSQSKTFDLSCGFGSATSHKSQPKSKANRCWKKIDISTEEPKVQQNLFDSNPLESDVLTVRNNRSAFKNKTSEEPSSFNLNCNMVDSNDNTPNTTNAEISSSAIDHSPPRFEMDICKMLPTCVQSSKRSWPQFGRKKFHKGTRDRLKSQKVHIVPKSQFRAAISKPNTNCSGSRQVNAMSKLRLKSGLDKSTSNSLEPQMPCLRSRSRLLSELCKPAKNHSDAQQVHTRSQLRKDLCKVYPKSDESQDLGLKTLSVSLHRLPSYVTGMRSYRTYCRRQQMEVLRRKRQGRSKQCEISLRKKTKVDSNEEALCTPSFLQSDLITEKDFPIDNIQNSSCLFLSSRSLNSRISTRKQSWDAENKKDASVINDAYPACKIAALTEKHSNKKFTSSSFKSTKKKHKFFGNKWSRSKRKKTKSLDKIKSCSFSHLKKTSLKENDFDGDIDQNNVKGSSIEHSLQASSSPLSNIRHFCEIPTDKNVSITRAIQANSACKRVLTKDSLSSSEKNSKICSDFSQSYQNRKGNATLKMSLENEHAKLSNNSIRSSPRLSSFSSNLFLTDNEHSVNTRAKDCFHIKLKSDLRNSKKLLQKGNHQNNICCIVERKVLLCHPVSKTSNSELVKYDTHAFKRTSYEQRTAKHPTNKEITPTLTILDASVQLERLPDGVCDMPSYKEFCTNKKIDEVKMLGMEDQSDLNKSESAYSESQAKRRSLKRKLHISQNQKKASKININKTAVCLFQAVERTSNSVLNSTKKTNAQKCDNDFINENAIDEFYDSEETDTASSNGEFSSSDDISIDFSNHFLNKMKFPNSQQQLLPKFTSSVKNYELDTSKNSSSSSPAKNSSILPSSNIQHRLFNRTENEAATSFELDTSKNYSSSQAKSSGILPSSNIQHRLFNRTENETATSSDRSAPIPFKCSTMNGPSIAKRYSSTFIKSKPIQSKTIQTKNHHKNVKASPLGSLNNHKKRVRKRTSKVRKARIRKRPNHAISGSKSSRKSTIKFDEPMQIKNILYGMNKNNYRLQHCTINKASLLQKRPESFIRTKVKRRQTLPNKRSVRHKSKDISGFFSRPIQLSVKLQRLPEYIYEKHNKGKPIMISSLLPIVENVRNIHWGLRMIHQIAIEHSYSERCVKAVPLARIEHSYSSWSAHIQ